MVISCSENAWIMRVIAASALAAAVASRVRVRVAGSPARATAGRLSISARISRGSQIRAVMWSQTTASSRSARTGLLVQTRPPAWR
jgi:hypothetical protein